MVIPAQSQDEVISHSPVICNCPAIIIQLPAPTSQVESTPPAIPINGITLADSGKTFSLHPGESFLLNFGTNAYDWPITIDNQKVLSREKKVMVIRGAQGVYKANGLGKAVLTVKGNPLCRNSIPACEMPSTLFKITVIVQ